MIRHAIWVGDYYLNTIDREDLPALSRDLKEMPWKVTRYLRAGHTRQMEYQIQMFKRSNNARRSVWL